MRILNRLTLKHLAMNKRRTIVTIIGIVLSTALMVGLGLLVSSFLQAMRLDVINSQGPHHAYFDNVTESEKEMIDLNVNVKDSYSYDIVGYAAIPSSNTYKPYLYIASADAKTFELLKLLEGRFPTNNNEIVLPSHLSNYGVDYKVGDEIELNIGPRVVGDEEVYSNNVSMVYEYNGKDEVVLNEELRPKMARKYKVVGIISKSYMEDYSSPGFMAFTTKEKEVVSSTSYVMYKNIAKTYEITDHICSNLSENASCNVQESLLYYYGVSRYSNINSTIMTLLIIALTLLSVGCIIVIYNSFAISTMERKKSFGLYSSLGATPKQIKYTVFFEAFLVGIIGIVIGVLGAFLGIYVLIQVLNFLIKDIWNLKLVFVVEPMYVIIPILFMLIVVYFSAFIPARKSGKVSAIELIRENDEIKIPKKRFKTSKLVRKLFGLEGEIALKNIKRNKRKYRITVLSLFISIVMFISFSTYLEYGLSTIDINKVPKYDILVSFSGKNEANTLEIRDAILSMNHINKAHYTSGNTYSFFLNAYPEEYYQKDYYEYVSVSSKFNEEEKASIQVAITILDNDLFQTLRETFHTKENEAILMNDIIYTNYTINERVSHHTKIFEKNISQLNMCSYSSKKQCHDFPIALVDGEKKSALLDEIPYSNDAVNLILSRDMAKDMNVESSYHSVTLQSDQYRDLFKNLEDKYKSKNNVAVYSPRIELEASRNALLAVKILLYGFISLVTLTGITSVFNTINTSLNLRRREFAMLRSIGLTPKGFNKMIFFESLFFGLKSLIYALPVSFFFIWFIHKTFGNSFQFGKILVPWTAIIIAVVGVFLIILMTMQYSVRKMKKDNILETLRDENI